MILRKKSKENHETHFSINPMLKDETEKIIIVNKILKKDQYQPRLGSAHQKNHEVQFLTNSMLNDEIKKTILKKDLKKKKLKNLKPNLKQK
jgi:hypothetical protein